MLSEILDLRFARKKRIERLATEVSWIIAGQAANVLGSLVMVRVLTEYLEPNEYGKLALGLTLATLVNQVVTGGLIAAIGRFYSIANEKEDLWGYFKAARRLLVIATAIILSFGIFLIGTLSVVDMRHWLWLATAALVFSILSSYNSALNVAQNAARQRSIVALHGGMDAWLKIGLAVGVMLWLGKNSAAVVFGFALSAMFVNLSQFFFLRRLIATQYVMSVDTMNEDWLRQMWQFAWPIIIGGLFNWGYYASQRWALELFVSTDEVGKFYALTQVAYTPIALAGSLFISFITPIIYSRLGNPKNHTRIVDLRLLIFRIACIGMGATLLSAAIALFVHEWVFHILVADKYREYSLYMPLVIIAAGMLQVSLFLSIYVTAQNKTSSFIWLSTVGNSIVVIFNLFFTSIFGFNGLVAAMVLGSIIHLAWMIRITRFFAYIIPSLSKTIQESSEPLVKY